MRPVLAPAARRLWRGTTTLQLCLSTDHGVLVEGLDAGARAVLTLLDGVRTRDQVVADAGPLGCVDPDAVLETLAAAGLLLDADSLHVPVPERERRHRLGPDLAALTLRAGVPAPDAMAARTRARVVVQGAGRIGGPLAALLADAGVGTVDVRDEALTRWEDLAPGGLGTEDVGQPRAVAMAGRLPSNGSTEDPTLVVLTEPVEDQLARVLVRAGVPHLAVRADGLRGVVGPLVLPGQSPCLQCQQLVRASIDPDWPHLLAYDEPAPRAEANHGVLSAAVASQAALQALELLEGGIPDSVGGTLELMVPGWRWRRRTWPAHPGCDCDAGRATAVA